MQLANMNNVIRNTAFGLVVLAAVSLLTRSFNGQSTTSTAPARHFYLTKGNFNGNQTLTACVSGYHFASFAELLDPAALTYNKSFGRSAADDGAGPPTADLGSNGLITQGAGWVRTGSASNSVSTLGAGVPTNCNTWTSGATTDNGEVGLFIPPYYNGTIYTPAVVFTNNAACDNSQGFNIGVWCVEN